jgi:serine/threonine protein kinase
MRLWPLGADAGAFATSPYDPLMPPPRRLRLRQGLEFETQLWGSWRLVERLGRGGNGEVWRARSRFGAVEVAIKVLTRLRGDGYPRFRQEVGILERLLFTDLAVLPVVTAHLPDELRPDNPPYYCMPVATRIAHALRNASVRDKAQAIAAIAETLGRLSAEQGIDSHRDIKPDNLFFYEGRPVSAILDLFSRQTEIGSRGRAASSVGQARTFLTKSACGSPTSIGSGSTSTA